MTKMKKWVAVALVATMVGGSLAACGSSDSSDDTDETTAETEAAEDTEASDDTEAADDTEAEEEDSSSDTSSSGETFTIGYNYYGEGSYALDTLADNEKFVIEAFGNESMGLSDDFQVDKIIQDIENMISSGCDGVILWLPADNLYETAIELCTEAGVPFAFADKIPSDEDLIAELLENEYFAGAVGPANAEYGTLTAEYALEQGYTSCIISSGSEGDPTDTPRIEAFTEAFEAGGGEVVSVIYTDSNDNIQPYTENALIANPDVDFVYGTGSDFGIGAAAAIENQGLDCAVLTAGLDSEAVELVASGEIEYIIGDFWISGIMAAVAMENYLIGNPLTDADGNMVFVDDIMPFELTADDYDTFQTTFIDNDFYSTEEIQAMSGISYDEFIELIDNYSFEDRVAAQAE